MTDTSHTSSIGIFEEKFGQLADAIQDMLFVIDKDDRVIFTNAIAAAPFGKKPKDMIGLPRSSLFSKEQSDVQKRTIDEVFRTGKPQNAELTVSFNGKTMWLNTWLAPLKNEQGETVSVLGISRDITAQKETETALRASEANYRAIFDSANDAIFIHDPQNGRILDVNQKMCEMYGYTHDEALATDIGVMSEGTPSYSQPEATEYVRKALQSGPQLFEWRAKDKSGRLFWVEVNLKKAVLGESERVVAIVRDITERKKIEEKLQESEERYKMLVETSPNAVTLTDLSGNITFASAQTFQLHGYRDSDELIGKNSFDLIAPQDRERARNNLRLALDNGSIDDVSYTLVRKDGSQFPGELSAALIRDREGKPKAFIANVRDVTKRLQREQAYIRLSKAVESSTEVIFITDVDGIITYINPQFTVLYGYTKEEIVGKVTPRVIKSGLLSKEQYKEFWDKLLRKQSVADEIVNKTKEGKLVQVDRSINPILDEKGNSIGFVAIQHDITERKKQESESKKRLDEIEKLNQVMVGRELKMVQMKEELERLRGKTQTRDTTSDNPDTP